MKSSVAPSHVALLYSVVLDNESRVNMEKLRGMAAKLGFQQAKSYIASGNLVYQSDAGIKDQETMLERAFEKTFGKRVDIIVKSRSQWTSLLRDNPYRQLSGEDGSRVFVKVMREPLHPQLLQEVKPLLTMDELLTCVAGNPWYYVPKSAQGTRLHGRISDRKLGVGTSRNWNTVQAIENLLEVEGV